MGQLKNWELNERITHPVAMCFAGVLTLLVCTIFFASGYINCAFYLPPALTQLVIILIWIEMWVWSWIENGVRFFVLLVTSGECRSRYLDEFLQFSLQLVKVVTTRV